MNIRKRSWEWKSERHRAYVLDGRIGGRRVRKQFPTRVEAELYRDQLIRERNAEQYGTLVDASITLADFATIYVEKKPWRTETYRERAEYAIDALKEMFGTTRLSGITPSIVEEYARTRLKDHAPSTVRQVRASAHRDQPDRSIVITRIGRS